MRGRDTVLGAHTVNAEDRGRTFRSASVHVDGGQPVGFAHGSAGYRGGFQNSAVAADLRFLAAPRFVLVDQSFEDRSPPGLWLTDVRSGLTSVWRE
jgi:hypothetical protein